MEWITILKCPITGSKLRALTATEIEDINRQIVISQIWQANGTPYKEIISKALTTIDGAYIYPIVSDIVLLLKDLALSTTRENLITETISDDKALVKNFYDQKGWHANEAGDYEDAVIFEDLRSVSKEYIKKCHDRVSRFLNPSGKYMLDAASGALQFPDYLQYSANYEYRVCVDFSFQALVEAKRKLGTKGICILCDLTNMPFNDNVFDGFISLNTIYHIPQEEQVTALKELYRVLAPNGKGVVVYEWFKHSQWMNICLLPFRGFTYIKNRISKLASKVAGTAIAPKMLYFHAHPYDYFRTHLPFSFELKVWRSISVPFMKYYVHGPLLGKQLLNWVYNKEEREPEKCGRKGEYPLFVFEKPHR